MASAGVSRDQVDAYWLGTMGSGMSGREVATAALVVQQLAEPSSLDRAGQRFLGRILL